MNSNCSTAHRTTKRLEVIASQTTVMASTAYSPMTTHVLNTSTGKPAANLLIKLNRITTDGAVLIKEGRTNADGRLPGLLTAQQFTPGTYMVRFETGEYFAQSSTATFYPHAEIVFTIADTTEHYHIPLLLSPYGYSTYRGS